MDRDREGDDRESIEPHPMKREGADRGSVGRNALERPIPTREHALVRLRDSLYRVSEAELETMYDIGRFRTIATDDLARHRYHGQATAMQEDVRALSAQGLVQQRTVWTGPRSTGLRLVVLTKLGKELLDRHRPAETGQAIYARFVKPGEVRHDAAIYRMYHAERQKLERAGARMRRIILDYELKRNVYTPLAKARTLPPAQYAKRQQEVAHEHGLKVIDGKIPLPDLRLEYETATGELSRVDLELTTGHYHGPALQAKAQAGFKFYAADGSASRLSRVLEERDITVAILSL